LWCGAQCAAVRQLFDAAYRKRQAGHPPVDF